jgi:undecaprenyl diphosphate synthase
MADLEARTGTNDRLDLWIAFDYGGRAELADAAKRLIGQDSTRRDRRGHFRPRALRAGPTDPDLLIRTAGDQRISNFLLWQLAYAELVFVEKPWPDFGEEDLRAALAEYANRERRFGGR